MLKVCATALSLLLPVSLIGAGIDSEVTVTSGRLTLAGTLSVPDGGFAPRVVVVMATGSGSQDRDETIFGHKPFRAVADSLAAHGYASLRLDDRGVGGSDSGPDGATTDDFAGDILAAVRSVRDKFPGVPVGVMGHSEGGAIAVKIAARGDCSFIVTLGAPAFRGDSIIMRQAREAFEQSGMGSKFEAMYPELRERYDIAMSGGLQSIVEMQLYTQLMRHHPEYAAVPAVAERVKAEVKAMAAPWYRNFLRYDPKADIEAVAVPWLALNGALDRQVTPDNLSLIREYNPAVVAMEMPGLNHLMLKCVTGLADEYERIQGDVAPEVTEAIISWLDLQTF